MRALAFVLVLVACRDNPNIDGTKVQASAATCTGVCNRITALCGYAPADCDDDAVDGGGYCQANFDDTMLTCMSTAASCEDAWNCQPAPPADDDAGDDASGDDASGE
jgi:hypothetical protein